MQYNTISRGQIPNTVNSQKLLKEFSKEIRHAERFLLSLNPPKPERESKRKKKKPLNKDFVDYEVADRISGSAFNATLIKTETQSSNNKNSPIKSCLKLTLPKSVSYPFSKSICADMSDEKQIELEGHRRVNKPGKQSPTVIRFKLGDNEIVRSTNDKGIVYGNFAIDQSVETPKELTWKQSSIYDFHDGSNESDLGGGFTIDEHPKRKKSSKSGSNKKSKKSINQAIIAGANLESDIPKNGIEELLKASAYALSSTGNRIEAG